MGISKGHKEETPKQRLESLRKVLRLEIISYGELAELQDLAVQGHIEQGDVELLEAAGVPEEAAKTTKSLKRWIARQKKGKRR